MRVNHRKLPSFLLPWSRFSCFDFNFAEPVRRSIIIFSSLSLPQNVSWVSLTVVFGAWTWAQKVLRRIITSLVPHMLWLKVRDSGCSTLCSIDRYLNWNGLRRGGGKGDRLKDTCLLIIREKSYWALNFRTKSFFFIFEFSMYMFIIKFCQLNSNPGPLVSEATALPTELQPLPFQTKSYITALSSSWRRLPTLKVCP